MALHKRDLRKNKLPDDFSQNDLDDLMAIPGALRKVLSGPNKDHNQAVIDGLLAQRGSARPAISASRFTKKF